MGRSLWNYCMLWILICCLVLPLCRIGGGFWLFVSEEAILRQCLLSLSWLLYFLLLPINIETFWSNAAHVLVDFVVFPPAHGRSVTDFWGWDAHEAQLCCPDDVSGDIGGCSVRRALNLLTPNDDYSGRTASLTSKRCILYIYSTHRYRIF